MNDLISKQAAIDTRRYTFGNDEFSLKAAYHDCKLVFDGITDDESYQEADTGLILYYANEIIYALHEVLEGKDTNVPSNDCISRQAVRLIESDSDAYPQEWNDDYEKGFTDALNKVLALPSAQPYTGDEIQKMQDLESAEIEKAFQLGREDALSEIVRCKDCARFEKKRGCNLVEGLSIAKTDSFCSYAERREE